MTAPNYDLSKPLSFSGYAHRETPAPDSELTRTGPGTPMGEYMRRFWQPVCLSSELTEVPKAIRILSEDLVAFRDRGGRIGVMHRHCAHRGASLEFGIIAERGIRCCYHGWHYDVDGTLLDAPCELDATRLKQTVCQGAYPAFERDGLVFAYMGPPEKRPEFPEYDSYTRPGDTRLIAFSNVYPCNWLQVYENVMDHFHTAVLHNNMTVAGLDEKTAAGVTLQGFGDMPILQWEATRDGNGCLFIAGRRLPNDKVWIRISEMVFPNYLQFGSVFPTGGRERYGNTGCTRWNVPVDDENMIMFGWRHFNSTVDPDGLGREDECGVDRIDFLVGQTGNRSYYEQQRAPGDWEAIVSQRRIAVHALEHPGGSDVGVYLCRRLLREAVRGKTPPLPKTSSPDHTVPFHAQDAVLTFRQLPPDEDRKLILSLGKKVLEISRAAESVPASDRDAFIRRRLDRLDEAEQETASQNATAA